MKDTFQIINDMQRDGVIDKYAIGGAVGATFYLEPAATLDVDIFVTLPTTGTSSLLTLTPIYNYLTARGSKVDGPHIVIGSWPVQFLPASNNLEREALAQAVSADVDGVRTWIMTAEHLAAIALHTGRSKDYARILQFLEQDALDRVKLKAILQRHGLTLKWEDFERKYLEK
jgi:hypothetical protein